jgi:uncharacterized glyoxalase superfamily protein PhnB
MAKRAKAIPDGYHTVTPYLTVRGADQAITFYKNAFGAEELMRMPGPGGKSIMHAEITIGDSRIFLSEELPEMGCRSPQSLGGTASSLHLYVEDVDAAFKRAVSAGAQVKMLVADMFWGDRFGKLIDPFGHEWGMATHTEDRTPEEIRERANAFFAQMAKSQQS